MEIDKVDDCMTKLKLTSDTIEEPLKPLNTISEELNTQLNKPQWPEIDDCGKWDFYRWQIRLLEALLQSKDQEIERLKQDKLQKFN